MSFFATENDHNNAQITSDNCTDACFDRRLNVRLGGYTDGSYNMYNTIIIKQSVLPPTSTQVKAKFFVDMF